MSVRLLHGDCLALLPTLPDGSVHAVVTDPPYDLTARKKGGTGAASLNLNSPAGRSRITTGGGFMGKEWDATGIAFRPDVWRECLRVLRPGGHLLAFGGTRTYHRMAVAIEDAGFEIRDCLMWLYAQGFPKSHNLSGEWNGWGTALKPSCEPIVMARKFFGGTVADNVARFGVGALNIDGCRVPTEPGDYDHPGNLDKTLMARNSFRAAEQGAMKVKQAPPNAAGRWPSNCLHDGSDEVLEAFAAFGQKGGAPGPRANRVSMGYGGRGGERDTAGCADSGNASRFFYCAKADGAEREYGLNGFPLKRAGVKNTSGRDFSESDPYREIKRQNTHPTIKPVSLMRWLCRLVTPPGGTVLDCFAGSGSTGVAAVLEGLGFIGIEREAEYHAIAGRRLAQAQPALALFGTEPVK